MSSRWQLQIHTSWRIGNLALLQLCYKLCLWQVGLLRSAALLEPHDGQQI